MRTDFMLLAIYNKPRLTFAEVCEAIGMSKQNGYNRRSAGNFPVPLSGDLLSADVRDVANELDRLQEEARVCAAAWRLHGKEVSVAEWLERSEPSNRHAS